MLVDKNYWIVICPESSVQGGLWPAWREMNCVAIGWPWPCYRVDGETSKRGWKNARDLMSQMRPGDEVIPYVTPWRIGPVGTITRVRLADDDWEPTVPNGAETRDSIDDGLGRRIEVEWWTSGMPSEDEIAITPLALRGKGGRVALAHWTIQNLSYERFEEIVEALRNPRNRQPWEAVW